MNTNISLIDFSSVIAILKFQNSETFLTIAGAKNSTRPLVITSEI